MRKKWRAIRKSLRRVSSAIKTIFGMPDYDRYLQHWYITHASPGVFPMTEREYYIYALRERYEKGGVTRCC
ncbi:MULTISPECIES: YbdD/YjiX family protein [Brevibacillus]|uniref:YbdD/YjiX family protein n=1 Tax=Brevibacillus invocatus TaxID=173959 RepID=A0A3M8CGV8_9BACL|nr:MULTISPECIES: YbdD/YjiX family protein [Brevibacillus]MCM3079077.1 YbdD/YjiX family protein [Brevibacillus invocatus]MCM3429860.1 YbdD/YjiX family protein [Brevibacillus invocatus]MDH4617056.1 YbdD/YjiX family protein [Brevibacillus sp. AY1]RNB74869.1 YbdD/YjiX family protein [Brevibacillus invocatus]